MMENGTEVEVLYENNKGWYGFRKWGIAGSYFFKKYQAHYGAGVYLERWVMPSPFYTGEPIIEYYDSKAELESRLQENDS